MMHLSGASQHFRPNERHLSFSRSCGSHIAPRDVPGWAVSGGLSELARQPVRTRRTHQRRKATRWVGRQKLACTFSDSPRPPCLSRSSLLLTPVPTPPLSPGWLCGRCDGTTIEKNARITTETPPSDQNAMIECLCGPCPESLHASEGTGAPRPCNFAEQGEGLPASYHPGHPGRSEELLQAEVTRRWNFQGNNLGVARPEVCGFLSNPM